MQQTYDHNVITHMHFNNDVTSIRFVIIKNVLSFQPCIDRSSSLREQQCTSFNNVSLQDNYFHWIPVYKPEEPCVLYCKTVETGFVLKVQSVVVNGTTCGKRNGGICIAGKCQVRV